MEGLVEGQDYLSQWDEDDRRQKEIARQNAVEEFSMEGPEIPDDVSDGKDVHNPYGLLAMTGSTLKIDQLKLHEACNHDSRLTGIVLALLEVITGEEEVFNALHPVTNQHIEHFRQQLRQAIGNGQ